MSLERIEELIAARNEASQAYFEGESIISDDQFDLIVQELEKLGYEDESVGHGYVPSGKIAHKKRMLSLRKRYTEEDIREFVVSAEARKYTVELKYDGGAASLIYGPDGYFEQAVTRGNGIYGEDITPAMLELIKVGKIPDCVQSDAVRTEVRGEVIVFHENFEALNASDIGAEYSNPRNTATGIIRRKNVDGIGPYVDFVAYDGDMPTWRLEEEGFTTSLSHFFETVSDDHVNGIMAHINDIEEKRKTLNFDTDGVVIKVADQKTRDALGEHSSYPNWAVAFKYKSIVKPTTLLDVEWNTSRTGRIVPVALFSPIRLVTLVSRATLHNYTFVQEMGLRIGDSIDVQRSNDVIPYVVGITNDSTRGTLDIDFPVACPVCGADVYMKSKDMMCSAGGCDPATIITYGLSVLGVLGVSKSIVGKLVKSGDAKDLVDMLGITAEQISALEGEGVVSGKKAVKAIKDATRNATVAKWIAALGIHKVALNSATQLAEKFGTLDELANATEESLVSLPRFGATKAKSVIAAQHRIAYTSNELLVRYNYRPVAAEKIEVPDDSPLVGRNVVLTGKFPTFSRNDATLEAKKLGAIVQSGVSKTTQLLIAGEDAGSKMQKATALGVEMMDASTFEELVRKFRTNTKDDNSDVVFSID